MGNESSQLEKHADMANRGGKVIGPSMSPTPSDDEQGRVFGPAMSPLPGEDEDDLRGPTSPNDRPKSPSKKKKRRKNQRESLERALTSQVGAVDESHQSPKRKSKKRAKKNRLHDGPQENDTQQGLNNGDTPYENAPHIENMSEGDIVPASLQSLLSDTKKKAHLDLSSSGPLSSDAQQLHVSHAHGGTPPSAQQPTANGILGYGTTLVEDAEEQAIAPSTQLNWRRRPDMHSQASSIGPRQLKREPSDNSGDEELYATSFADATRDSTTVAMRENDPHSELSWCHKSGLEAANTPIIEIRTGQEGHSNEVSPDLLPSQIKNELNSDSGLGPGSDSDSPSAARLERLSGSRSRSASKASTSRVTRVADQDVGQTFVKSIQIGCADSCFAVRIRSLCSIPSQTVVGGNISFQP